MKTSITKKDYQDWLNDLPIPFCDLKSNGGRIPDDAEYGEWLRRHDPIAFNVGFCEWSREEMRRSGIAQ